MQAGRATVALILILAEIIVALIFIRALLSTFYRIPALPGSARKRFYEYPGGLICRLRHSQNF